MLNQNADTIGPILFLDDMRGRQMHIAALFITSKNDPPPPIALSTDIGLLFPLRSIGLEPRLVTPRNEHP